MFGMRSVLALFFIFTWLLPVGAYCPTSEESCEEPYDCWGFPDYDTLPDEIQAMVDCVEYCNAEAVLGNTWALLRAANGHPEPYGVTFWEIANESYAGGGASTPSVDYYSATEYAAI